MRKFFKYPIVFISIIAVFFVAMILVHCIPAGWLTANVSESVEQINAEGLYPTLFFGLQSSMLDNFTDGLMINMNRATNVGNPIFVAMDNLDYARYWHGYQVILRPLLVFLNIRQIRYLGMIAFFFLFCILFLKLKEKTGIGIALTFLFAMTGVCLVLLPISLQYGSVFYITFLFMLYLLSIKDIAKAKYMPLAFMIVGMITNFLDLLTVPLLTLGLPLLLYFVLCFKNARTEWWKSVKTLGLLCICWGLGYGICWGSKWVIASIVTKKNVIKSAIDQIFFRTMGNEDYPISRLGTMEDNFKILFIENKLFGVLTSLIVLCLAIFAIIFRTDKEHIKQSTLLLMIAVFPYIWYFVLANHSGIHAWFTYRLQAVTVFGVLLALLNLINRQKLKDFIGCVKDKGKEYYDKLFQKK